MPLRPDSTAMTLLLGLTVGLAPLATDQYLPVLPELAAYFDAPAWSAQATLSAFMLGFAGGQVVFGPISDRVGRRVVLISGYAAFVVLTLVCAFAPSIEVLIVGRFLQAIAASAPFVLTRAIVRDTHDGVEAARVLGLMSIISTSVPAVAPALGGVIALYFDWRAQFIFMALVGIINLVWVFWGLPETLRRPTAEKLSIRSIVGSLAIVWQNHSFRANAILICLAFSGMFTIISASPFVLQQVYGMNEIGFALAFGSTAGASIVASLIGFRFVRFLGLDGVLGLGVYCAAAAGIFLSLAVLFDASYPFVIAGMMIFGLSMGFTFPPATAGAMAPFPYRSGAASSLSGFLQMAVAAVIGVVVGFFVGETAWPLAVPILIFGILSVIVFLATRKIRAAAYLIDYDLPH